MSGRLPHAVLDLDSRRHKALKIERLLDLEKKRQPIRLLEIGTGSGGIADYFATHQNIFCDVKAVDVIDQRLVQNTFSFQIVKDTSLPFVDNSFDVVLSNHVIEHVGDRNAQLHHLLEIKRVLDDKGVCYLAVPNRWMLVEPHYRLIFLSWLPKSMRDYYVRLLGKGKLYDCEPLSLQEVEQLFDRVEFTYQNISTKALKETLDIESHQSFVIRLLGKLPSCFFERFTAINPTLIYRLEAPS